MSGTLVKAMALHKEEERLYQNLKNVDNLLESLGDQVKKLQARGEFSEAMKLLKKQEQICRERGGNKEFLQAVLGNQALLIAIHFKKPHEALPLAEEAYNMTLADGLSTPLAKQIQSILDVVQKMVR